MKPERSKRPQQSKRQEAPSKTEGLPKWLLDEADTIKAMIQWYKSRESTAMDAEERRPVFVGKTRNSGIRANTEILDRALKKARHEKLKTGGNLSQLVEWLLWVYIGKPDDVVERDISPE